MTSIPAGATPSGPSILAPAGGLVLTALLWGAMIPMTHALATQVFDPFFLSMIRYLIPAPVLVVLCLGFDRTWPFAGDLPLKRLVILGLSMATFSICFTIGIMLSEPIRAAIVMSCSPLVATLLSKLLNRSFLPRGFKLAMTAAIVGGALVAIDAAKPRAAPAGLEHLPYLGEALLVCAMTSWSWYSLKVQTWLAPLGWSQLRISLLTSLAGGLIMVLVFTVIDIASPGRVPSEWPSPGTWFMLMWMGVGGAGIAIVLWNFGVSRIGVPVASLYGNLAPVFSVGVAAMFFGAGLSTQQLIGGAVILAGIARMQWLQIRGR